MLMLFTVCGAVTRCASCITTAWHTRLEFSLSVLFPLVVRSEAFLVVLGLASSNDLSVFGILVCHSNDSRH